MRMSFVRFVAFLMALILCLSVVATALAYNTIPYGEESQDVRDMQSKLKSKGYYKGKVDGKFGPETRRAVRKFQEAIGITVDGKPGNRTLTALYEGTSAINGTRDRERIDSFKAQKSQHFVLWVRGHQGQVPPANAQEGRLLQGRH